MASAKGAQKADILSPITRLEAPFIKIEIGGYTFGIYEGSTNYGGKTINQKFPNYVKSVKIVKINGQVNKYTIEIEYPVTQDDDPNFFEKLFSSVSSTRTLKIDYGDSLLPNYVYRDEEALITDLTSSINMKGSVISYTVSAVSSAQLTLSGSYNFPTITAKPSDVILDLLYNKKYNLLKVFTGMADKAQVLQSGLIAGDDKTTTIPSQVGASILDRLQTLANNMTPANSADNSATFSDVYALTTYEDTTGIYGGPYFKVAKVSYSASTLDQLCTYQVDIGHPTSNIVQEFSFTDNGGWSLLYNYASEARTNDTVKRINSDGQLVDEYQPLIAGTTFTVYNTDMNWWKKVTEFNIKARLVVKGILKPAILMSYLKVNVWFYGRKHISSGYYLITSQTDSISETGFWTTLELTRVASDDSESVG